MSQGLQEELLTVGEAAAQIAVTESAIRNATIGGRLPFVRKYGRNLIRPVELHAYQIRTQCSGEKLIGRPAQPAE